MCGRFSLTVDPSDLQIAFPDYIFPQKSIRRYNIAPSQPILALPNDGRNNADFFSWGLIPSWAKDISIGAHLVNARAETLAEKPSFRSAYKYHRCIIFASGFFEWRTQPGEKHKQPFHIQLRSGQVFGIAGLWEHWVGSDGSEIRSAVIITTIPNEMMATIHNRMPVIFPLDVYTKWLEPNPQAPALLQPLLTPYPASEMIATPVSTLVNDPANDDPRIIEAVS